MLRTLIIALAFSMLATPPLRLFGQEIIDPDEARKDTDFLIQGEYLGEGRWPGGDKAKIGAQVVAEGDHKFRAILFRGGLPGAGWERGDERLELVGEFSKGAVKLVGQGGLQGHIAEDRLNLDDADAGTLASLKRTKRTSPTLGAKPEAGAVVLFDGTNADLFADGKLTEMKTLEAGCKLRDQYRIARIHIEFRLSWRPDARGQRRSNSGVHLAAIPEIQVLDSFGLEGKKNECGAFYGRRAPDVNMCLPPLVWQTYDVEFTPQGEGKNVLATVRHNGVVVHKNYDTRRKEVPHSGMSLQRHGNRVQYRNIWLVEQQPKLSTKRSTR